MNKEFRDAVADVEPLSEPRRRAAPRRAAAPVPRQTREPVLKGKLRTWLPLREEVLGFCQAPRAHGGSGAVLVLLKNP